MLDTVPTFTNANVTPNGGTSKVEFSTGDCLLRFVATGTSHTIGLIDDTGTFTADNFSVKEYIEVIARIDGADVTMDKTPPSIYETDDLGNNTAVFQSATGLGIETIDMRPGSSIIVYNIVEVKTITTSTVLTAGVDYNLNTPQSIDMLTAQAEGVYVEFFYNLV